MLGAKEGSLILKKLLTIAATALIACAVVSASSPATASGPQVQFIGQMKIKPGVRCGQGNVTDAATTADTSAPFIFTSEQDPFVESHPGTTNVVDDAIGQSSFQQPDQNGYTIVQVCLVDPAPRGEPINILIISG